MARRAAGILLWRRVGEGVEVLLAHPGGPLFAARDHGSWTVPKGEPDPGEDEFAAARREFAEEIGVDPPGGEAVLLGEARQRGGKVNVVWAIEGSLDGAAVRSNSFEMEWPPRSGRRQSFPEVDRVAWFDLESEAYRRIRDGQSAFLDRLRAVLDQP
ncbi:MAG: NUDIX domain-containing protein [Actinomycetales bacterium]